MNTNPYDDTTVYSQEASGRRSLWRIVPSLAFLVLGVFYIYLTIAVVADTLINPMSEIAITHSYSGLAFTALVNVPVGIGWIATAIFLWLARYKKAFYTAGAAFSLCATYFFLMDML